MECSNRALLYGLEESRLLSLASLIPGCFQIVAYSLDSLERFVNRLSDDWSR